MIQTIRDECTDKDHEGEIQVAIEKLGQQGYSVTNVRRVKSMTLLWGENVTEIYYEASK